MSRDHLAIGVVSMLAADPGTGKSFLARLLAAEVANGGEWPGGISVSPGKVLIADGEDGPEETRRRLDALGFGRWGRIVLVQLPVEEWTEQRPLPRLNEFIYALELTLKARGPFSLVIIDPMVAFHNENENSSTAMRKFMMETARLAREHHAAILLIHHLNKAQKTGDLASIRGSSDLLAAPRCVLTVMDTRDPDVKALVVIKTNLGPRPEPQGFRIVDGRIEWVGPVKALDPRATQEDAARELIDELLGSGAAVSARTIYNRAWDMGIGSGTLERVARIMDVIKRTEGKHHIKVWQL